jgi:KipI family sensor histidine kinase inhibitor
MTPQRPSRLLPYGPAAVLAEFDDDVASATMTEWAAAALGLDGVVEAVPGARTVLVTGPGATDDAVAALTVGAINDPVAADIVEIAVRYDGADLADVGERTGLTVDEVVEAHTAPIYRCAFCGFAPGFSYLEGLDERLVVRRRASPRQRVPAGAVAIASGYTAVYPAVSPGGWNLLGQTDATMFDLTRDPPALAPPGARVRFLAL